MDFDYNILDKFTGLSLTDLLAGAIKVAIAGGESEKNYRMFLYPSGEFYLVENPQCENIYKRGDYIASWGMFLANTNCVGYEVAEEEEEGWMYELAEQANMASEQYKRSAATTDFLLNGKRCFIKNSTIEKSK